MINSTSLRAQITERQVQKEVVEYLRHLGYYVQEFAKSGTHSNCPKCGAHIGLRGSIPTGWPDVMALMPDEPPLFIECKRPVGGKVTEAQADEHERLRDAGAWVIVARGVKDLQEMGL